MLILLVFLAFGRYAHGGECKAPDGEEIARVIKYEAKVNHIADPANLLLAGSAQENGECYWKFQLAAKNGAQKFSVFLSPDRNFIASDIRDLRIDPLAQEQSQGAAMMQVLMSDQPPSLGPSSAAVTIVEFADFACSFCRQIAGNIKKAVASSNDVQLIYRNLPAPQHLWARAAAEVGECVAMQDVPAFWRLHDFFFSNQPPLNEESTYDVAVAFLAKDGSSKIDTNRLTECFHKRKGMEAVQRDIDLGRRYGVAFTPTLFVNGVRYVGVMSSSELETLIALAKESARNFQVLRQQSVGAPADAKGSVRGTSTAGPFGN